MIIFEEWYQYQSWGKLQKGGFSLKETTSVPIRLDQKAPAESSKPQRRRYCFPSRGKERLQSKSTEASWAAIISAFEEMPRTCRVAPNHSLNDSLIHGSIEIEIVDHTHQQDHLRLRVTNGKHIGNPFVSRVLPITGAISAIWAVETIQLF